MQRRPQCREEKFVVQFREVREKNSKMPLFDTGSYPVQKRSPEAGKNGEHLLLTGDYLPLKPGFHIVVSVVSVVRKKFIGQI